MNNKLELPNKNIIIQDTGLKRDTLDKYYTKSSIAQDCINNIKNNIKIKKTDLIIEPSAGNGSFIPFIKEITKNHKFYDIKPEGENIVKQNFLELDITDIKHKYKKIHIIGNPPFGRQSTLVKQFIKKCCEFADTISFILPKSFKKDSYKNIFDLFFHLDFEVDLPNNSFLVNGIVADVPCVFQIWIKKDVKREVMQIPDPIGFKFCTKKGLHDISVRRVGVNAGNICKETTDNSTQSHYFIKFINNKNIDENIEELKKIKFDFNNTVGPKSISKPELIMEFNKYLNNLF